MSSFVWHSRHTKELIFAILEEMMIPQPGGLGDRCAKIWVSGVRRRSRRWRTGNNSQAGDRWTGEAGEMQTEEAGDRRP